MERERITISIKKSVLGKVDQFIDGINIRNRSHAFETLALKAMGQGNSKHAVIMLGGDDALELVPMVMASIKQLSEIGFEKVIIALGFLGEKVKAKIASEQNFGIQIDYLEKGEGSGGALNQLKDTFTETFIVFNSSYQLDVNLNKLLSFHREHNSVATIATDSLEDFDGIYIFEPAIYGYLGEGFSMIEENLLPKLFGDNKAIIYPAKQA